MQLGGTKDAKKILRVMALVLFLSLSAGLTQANASDVVNAELIAENVSQACQLDTTDRTDNKELVTDFWECINGDDWTNWVSFYPDTVQSCYTEFITPHNVEANCGILTVTDANVTKVTKVDNAYAPKMYPELQTYFASETTYECYKVDVNLVVKEENDYFQSGENSFLTILVKDGEDWYAGAICGCPNELVSSDEAMPTATGIGYGLIDFIPPFSTICVKAEKGSPYDMDFTEFITNVTCNEIGNENFPRSAIVAQIMAVKMCGWWAKAGKYRAAMGCDISNNDLAILTYYNCEEKYIEPIRQLVEEHEGYVMLSSDYKLFYASFYAGEYNANGEGQGRLRQNGAKYLAREYGCGAWDILHYYYDNSSYNNPSVGVIILPYLK